MDPIELNAILKELPTDGGKAPEWVPVLPIGEVKPHDGRQGWINDRPEDVITASMAPGNDIPIDWEHSTQIRGSDGEPAPAAGWIPEFKIMDGWIWGRSAWGATASGQLERKEYRYGSPAFLWDKETRRVIRITSYGLTNTPALINIPALARTTIKEPPPMEKEVLAALGLAAGATAVDATKAIETLKSQVANPPIDKFVPQPQHEAALLRAKTAEEKLAKLSSDELTAKITTAVDKAIEEGKLVPATRDYYLGQCKREGGLQEFEAFLKTQPVIAPVSDLGKRKPPDSQTPAGELTPAELEMCRQTGVTPEAFKKTKAELAK